MHEKHKMNPKCNLNMQPMQPTQTNLNMQAMPGGRAGGTNAGRRAGGWNQCRAGGRAEFGARFSSIQGSFENI